MFHVLSVDVFFMTDALVYIIAKRPGFVNTIPLNIPIDILNSSLYETESRQSDISLDTENQLRVESDVRLNPAGVRGPRNQLRLHQHPLYGLDLYPRQQSYPRYKTTSTPNCYTS